MMSTTTSKSESFPTSATTASSESSPMLQTPQQAQPNLNPHQLAQLAQLDALLGPNADLCRSHCIGYRMMCLRFQSNFPLPNSDVSHSQFTEKAINDVDMVRCQCLPFARYDSLTGNFFNRNLRAPRIMNLNYLNLVLPLNPESKYLIAPWLASADNLLQLQLVYA